MTIDRTFMNKKLERLEEVQVIFSQVTKLPYVVCDADTMDDLIHIFSDAEVAAEFVKTQEADQVLLRALKLRKEQLKGLYMTLYAMGVNAVAFHEKEHAVVIQLEELEQKPDMEALAKEKLPVLNPTLQLSAIYFLQEIRRQNRQDLQNLAELEEEMLSNLARATFVMAVDVTKNPDESASQSEQVRLPFVKDQEQNVYQPIFSDFTEFQRYYKQNAAKMRVLPLRISQLPSYLLKDSKGFLLNPAGFCLQISPKQIERILQMFPETEQK